MQWAPLIAGHRYVMFKMLYNALNMLLMRPCILTPTHVTTNGTCVRSHFLWQVGRGGQRGAMTLRCLFIGNNICYAHASPHSTGTPCTRFLSPVRSVVHVSFCPAVWVIGPGLRWPYRNRYGVVVWEVCSLHICTADTITVTVWWWDFFFLMNDKKQGWWKIREWGARPMMIGGDDG